MSKKPALGRGIDALFGEAAYVPEGVKPDKKPLTSSEEGQIRTVPIELVAPNPGQPRKDFDQDALEELAASIKEKGILQPILVEEYREGYRIIAGERRFRASLLGGVKKLPVMVHRMTEEERLEAALIENVQREDLNPLETAHAYKAIMEAAQLSQEEVARKVGKKRSTVANSLRLLRLDEDMRRTLVEGLITPGHARAILSLENHGDQRILHSHILKEELSVRKAEKMAADLAGGKWSPSKAKKASPGTSTTPELRQIEQQFINTFGTKVQIKGDNHGGTIEISYLSMEDLERILEILG